MTLDFDALPSHYQVRHERIYAEATGEAQRAFMAAWLQRHQTATEAAISLAKELGAQHVLNPGALGQPEPVRTFGFDEKPTDKAWRTFRRTARDRFWRCYAADTPEGLALKARMDALPLFPCQREIEVFAGLVTNVSYESSLGRGCGGAGDPFSGHFAYCGDRYFIYFANPFRAMAEWAKGKDETFRFTQPADGLNWRLGDGWTLLTKAEIDLAFAEHKVAQERAAQAQPELAGA